MEKTFTFFTDPGHGWLAVSYSDVLAAGLDLINFSRYSYAKGQTLFLEEDLDAGVFLKAWTNVGLKYKLTEINDNRESFVRNLNRIR